MSEAFVIRLLGVVQIEREGNAVRGFESRKALALLCYLAAQGQPVSRARLANLFWGDLDEEKGRANLSRVLHNDGLLAPGCLQVDRAEVSLPGGAHVQLDVATFAQLSAAGDAESLAAAAQLYRGEFMDGAYLDGCPEFETWHVTQQEVWRQRMAKLLGRLIAAHRERGDYERGLACAQQLLGLDNWREEAHRQVMLLQALSGQRSAALAQYQVCRQVLAEELGVEPSQQTRELYERIRGAGNGYHNGNHNGNHNGRLPRPEPALTEAQPPVAPKYVPADPHEKALSQIATRLEHPCCRLLVVTGGNGAGVAWQYRLPQRRGASLRDGSCDVDLAALAAAGGLDAALAAALRLPAAPPRETPRQLFEYLDDKELLLMIRNFEPQDGATGLLEDILKRAPGVQILVTAPQPLEVCGEWVVDLKAPLRRAE